jgi:hypothetical protein
MDKAMNRMARDFLLLLGMLAFPSTLFAHRLDEYLQATLVQIEPRDIRLQINLTPGVDVAEQILPLMDPNRDGVISSNEAAAYADSFKRDLTVRLDDREIDLDLTASHFRDREELRSGWGFIQLEFSLAPVALNPGVHHFSLTNRHLHSVSVYLFNAGKSKSASIEITRQIRNETQSLGEIEFSFHPQISAFATNSIPIIPAAFVGAATLILSRRLIRCFQHR